MKKLLFLSVCLTIVTYAQAQVAFNPKIGVNFSKITSKDIALSEEGAKAGFNAGIDFRVWGDESRVFFQPGLHYYNVGSQFKVNATESGDNGTVRTDIKDIVNVHSLRVPLNAGVYLTNTDSPVRVRLNGGVTPSFVLGVGESNLDIRADDFKKIYWSLNGGLGFDFSLVTLDFNYDHALSDVLSSVDRINANNINGRNRGLSISLGVVL